MSRCRAGLGGLALLVFVAAGPLVAASRVEELAARLERLPDERVVAALLAGSRDLPGLPVADRLVLAEALAPLAARCFDSDELLPEMQRLGLRRHTVAGGETPGAILRRYGMRNAYLERLNPDYDDTRLGIGQILKVHDCRGSRQEVVVIKHAYRCLVFQWLPAAEQHVLWACFPVGIGTAERPTPVGRTRVTTVVRDPSWTHPDTRELIPPGDPRNVLGGYWIGLAAGDDGRFQSIGFHGYTGAPVDDWLERGGSRGCLRLRQADIARLFAIARRGIPVQITD